MELNQKLFHHFAPKADGIRVEHLCIGLGYTAVVNSQGGVGLAGTMFKDTAQCTKVRGYVDFEGGPALTLLEHIKSSDSIHRAMALALINSLNHADALALDEDRQNRALFGKLALGKGTRVAMVGYFRPIAVWLKELGAQLEVFDLGRGLGDREEFYGKLRGWAEALIMTSTSILNETTEEVLARAGRGLKTVLLGPSTPLAREPFAHLPVHMLAGMAVLDGDRVVKAVRHGTGTPVIQKYARKVYLDIED
ncbi:MAG: DUF364 domain-containing protein [Desulfohalobiaceae bacterium]|nr:DUF364 domain-containing protein [Desulfohalobiaceae bacterium]